MAFETTFGEMEATLAQLHGVASSKRVAFQGRLRTILKLGVPVTAGQGRAATFGAGDFMLAAIFVELSQLGLQPERAAELHGSDNFPVFASVKRSVDLIRSGDWDKFLRREETDVEPVFLYLDPKSWSPVMEPEKAGRSLLWAGARTVTENITRVTSSWDHRRLALLNVTALVDQLAMFFGAPGQTFLDELERWARTGTSGHPGRDVFPPWEKQ